QIARLIALSEAGIGERRRREYRQALIVILVIHIQRNPAVKVSPIKAIQEYIRIIRRDRKRRPAYILQNAAQLPATQEAFHDQSLLVQEPLTRTNWQLVYARDVCHMPLVVARYRIFRLLVEAVLRTKVKG